MIKLVYSAVPVPTAATTLFLIFFLLLLTSTPIHGAVSNLLYRDGSNLQNNSLTGKTEAQSIPDLITEDVREVSES